MDVAIYKKITHGSQADQEVRAEQEEAVVEKEVEASEGGVKQPARGDKDQSPMQFGCLTQHDGERKERAEGRHVKERNDEERLRSGLVESVGIEAAHYDGGTVKAV